MPQDVLREIFLLFLWDFVSTELGDRSVVSFWGWGASAVETPRLMLVSSVVSFGGRGARLRRHPG